MAPAPKVGLGACRGGRALARVSVWSLEKRARCRVWGTLTLFLFEPKERSVCHLGGVEHPCGVYREHPRCRGAAPKLSVLPQNSRCCPKTPTAAPVAQRGRAGAHGAAGSRLCAGCLGVICGGEPTPETQFGHASCPSTALLRFAGCGESGAGLRGPGEWRWRSLCRAQGVVVMSAKQELGLQ